jgi:hypothetical protein
MTSGVATGITKQPKMKQTNKQTNKQCCLPTICTLPPFVTLPVGHVPEMGKTTLKG